MSTEPSAFFFTRGSVDPIASVRDMACQRTPTRLTGPPRFIGVPGRTTARATGRGRNTTPGLTTHPTGYATYWQYTTALACSVLAATKPVISSADSAIESFILASSVRNLQMAFGFAYVANAIAARKQF